MLQTPGEKYRCLHVPGAEDQKAGIDTHFESHQAVFFSAAMKARIFSGDLMPPETSTPLLTSTA